MEMKDISPADYASYLEKNAHLEGMTTGAVFLTKFYTLGDMGFKVVSTGNEVTYVSKISIDEIKRILSCSNTDFGEW